MPPLPAVRPRRWFIHPVAVYLSIDHHYFGQNLEEINVLRITLDTQIEDLEQHFETAHINYLQVRVAPER